VVIDRWLSSPQVAQHREFAGRRSGAGDAGRRKI